MYAVTSVPDEKSTVDFPETWKLGTPLRSLPTSCGTDPKRHATNIINENPVFLESIGEFPELNAVTNKRASFACKLTASRSSVNCGGITFKNAFQMLVGDEECELAVADELVKLAQVRPNTGVGNTRPPVIIKVGVLNRCRQYTAAGIVKI